MKFLILALCVCTATAASYGNYGSFGSFGANSGGYKPYQYRPVVGPAKVQAIAQVSPVVIPYAKAVVAPTPVVAPAPVVVPTPALVKNYNSEAHAQTLRDNSEIHPDGYSYSYETDNGIAADATGAVKRVGDSEVLAVQGSYRYVAPDGTPVVFSYIADENGYQPHSDLLPVGPPIPEPIRRSLEYIAAHPQQVDEYKKY